MVPRLEAAEICLDALPQAKHFSWKQELGETILLCKKSYFACYVCVCKYGTNKRNLNN